MRISLLAGIKAVCIGAAVLLPVSPFQLHAAQPQESGYVGDRVVNFLRGVIPGGKKSKPQEQAPAPRRQRGEPQRFNLDEPPSEMRSSRRASVDAPPKPKNTTPKPQPTPAKNTVKAPAKKKNTPTASREKGRGSASSANEPLAKKPQFKEAAPKEKPPETKAIADPVDTPPSSARKQSADTKEKGASMATPDAPPEGAAADKSATQTAEASKPSAPKNLLKSPSNPPLKEGSTASAPSPKTEPASEPTPPASDSKAPNMPRTGFAAESNPSPTTPPPPQPPSPPAAPAPASNNPLTAEKTDKPGRVRSPYAPFRELDVTGLPSGTMAIDPTTQKVFRVP